MATTKQWLAGCGIGCLVLALIIIGLGTGSVFYIKNQVESVQAWSEENDRLLSRLDEVEDYTPAPDGTVESDRLELFLDIHDGLSAERAEFNDRMSVFPRAGERNTKSFGNVIKVLKGLKPLVDAFGAYQVSRNESLLERDMEPGEYYYIHTLAYHSWLGNSPDDGPWTVYDMDDDGGGANINIDDEEFGQDATLETYNRTLRALLRNQRAALPPVGTDDEQDEMRRRLDDEIEKLDDDWERTVWADGLPAVTAACLEPYRDRFEDSYDPVTSVFDLWIASD